MISLSFHGKESVCKNSIDQSSICGKMLEVTFLLLDSGEVFEIFTQAQKCATLRSVQFVAGCWVHKSNWFLFCLAYYPVDQLHQLYSVLKVDSLETSIELFNCNQTQKIKMLPVLDQIESSKFCIRFKRICYFFPTKLIIEYCSMWNLFLQLQQKLHFAPKSREDISCVGALPSSFLQNMLSMRNMELLITSLSFLWLSTISKP